MGRKSVLTTSTCCVECGNPETVTHHIFPGSCRSVSDKYGYVIPLCVEHHTGRAGIHFNSLLMLKWKIEAQKHFEANLGTREDFIKVFNKSYL